MYGLPNFQAGTVSIVGTPPRRGPDHDPFELDVFRARRYAGDEDCSTQSTYVAVHCGLFRRHRYLDYGWEVARACTGGPAIAATRATGARDLCQR